MKLWDASMLLLFAPRVVHELPGRLRVHLPVLRKITKRHGVIVDTVAKALAQRAGILDITFCLATGNVLLKYDPNRLTKSDVMTCLRDATRVFLVNRDRLSMVTEEQTPDIAWRVSAWLGERLAGGPLTDKEVRIPDDVLG